MCYLSAGVRLGDKQATSWCHATKGINVPSPATASIQRCNYTVRIESTWRRLKDNQSSDNIIVSLYEIFRFLLYAEMSRVLMRTDETVGITFILVWICNIHSLLFPRILESVWFDPSTRLWHNAFLSRTSCKTEGIIDVKQLLPIWLQLWTVSLFYVSLHDNWIQLRRSCNYKLMLARRANANL